MAPAQPRPGPSGNAGWRAAVASHLAAVLVAALALVACREAAPPTGTGENAADDFAAALRGADRDTLARLAADGRIPPNALRRALNRRCDRLELLLDVGVDATEFDGAAALAHALVRDLPACAEKLSAAGARLDAWGGPGRHPLTAAIRQGDRAQVARLLEIGFPIDAPDRHGDTALVLASRNGDLQLVQSLLARGADVEVADRDEWTALAHAARSGRADLVSALLAAAARADVVTTLGWSPLHLAAQGGHRGTALALLAAGAPPDEVSHTAETPLVWAARTGDRVLAAALIAAGADAGGVIGGLTPGAWARAAGHAELAVDLERAAEGGR